MEQIETVDSVNGTPALHAASAACASPRRAHMPEMPIGPSATGIDILRPNSVVLRSILRNVAQHPLAKRDLGQVADVLVQRALRRKRRHRCSRTESAVSAAARPGGNPWSKRESCGHRQRRIGSDQPLRAARSRRPRESASSATPSHRALLPDCPCRESPMITCGCANRKLQCRGRQRHAVTRKPPRWSRAGTMSGRRRP